MTQQTADRMLSDAEIAEIEQRIVSVKATWSHVTRGTHELKQIIDNDVFDLLFTVHTLKAALPAAPAGDVGDAEVNAVIRRLMDAGDHEAGGLLSVMAYGCKALTQKNDELLALTKAQTARLSAPPPASPEVVELLKVLQWVRREYGVKGQLSGETLLRMDDHIAAALRAMGGKA